jgi:hypothetical protein
MKTITMLASAILLAAQVASAQTAATPDAGDSRWQAWLGCWQLAGRGDGPQVCVAPLPQSPGVTLTTKSDGKVLLEQKIIADGAQQPLAEAACRGWQRAEWSRNGKRLFTHGELACGDERRVVSGVSFIGAQNTWIDIQVVEVAGRDNVRVRRYRPVTEPSRPRPSAGPLALDEITELSAALPLQALEAAVTEAHTSFPLNRRSLIALDGAHVPDSVTDLLVALAFPDRFVVDRRQRPESFSSGGFASGMPPGLDAEWASIYPYFWPYAYSGYLAGSMMYDYSPLGYGYWGGPNVGYLGAGGAAGGGPTTTPAVTGRAVEGRGYTRVRPREASADAGGSGGQQSGSRASSTAPDSGSSSSGSSPGATSQGYSSGGSGADGGGRTAQPR